MFILGGFGEERMVPVGASFPDRGVRNDQHDAVGAQLMIPIGRNRPEDAPPAAGGAPQPAEATSHAEQAISPDTGGPPQPAEAPLDAEEPTPPDWAGSEVEEDIAEQDNTLNEAARELHEDLLEKEEAEDISMDLQLELRKILFKKRTVTLGGIKRQYVASAAEVFSAIKKLLKRRRDFMAARDLHDAHPANDGASQPAGHRYLFTQEDRRQVMQEWKDEFHARPEQEQQQKRDSWKPRGQPDGPWWGRNTKAVRSGKHSRFARHLQLEAGSKTMAELIIYTGRYDPEFLSQAHAAADRSGASQPVANTTRQKELKRRAAQAKLDYRMTCMLRRKLEEGKVDLHDLDRWERDNLRSLENGSLLRRTNDAVAAYGHGTIRRDDGETMEIGGSTGGITRFLLDGYAEPDVATFLARR